MRYSTCKDIDVIVRELVEVHGWTFKEHTRHSFMRSPDHKRSWSYSRSRRVGADYLKRMRMLLRDVRAEAAL